MTKPPFLCCQINPLAYCLKCFTTICASHWDNKEYPNKGCTGKGWPEGEHQFIVDAKFGVPIPFNVNR